MTVGGAVEDGGGDDDVELVVTGETDDCVVEVDAPNGVNDVESVVGLLALLLVAGRGQVLGTKLSNPG